MLNIENFCIGCQKEVMGIGQQHPLFRGALCNICHVRFRSLDYNVR
jgi:Cysteine rich ADD domain in DNMT3